MKARVNQDRCTGHARCSAVAPRVYQLDELGYNRMGEFLVAPELKDEARRGALACPERAIEILDD